MYGSLHIALMKFMVVINYLIHPSFIRSFDRSEGQDIRQQERQNYTRERTRCCKSGENWIFFEDMMIKEGEVERN